jgi:dTDP-4-amino-4,6-dideoxygalactose transaminase
MITPRTTGIIGVHLWGRPCAIDALQDIADRHYLQLMFDSAHAFGCSHNGKKIGGLGRCEVFSFHATKFFNSFEGGAVLTNDDDLAEKCRLMRNFGFSGYDNIIYHGTNGKMVEVCAAMGITSLENIETIIDVNRRNYHAYRDALDGIPGLNLIHYNEAEACNYQYIVVEVGHEFPLSRDEIIKVFHAENILVRKYFWPGCHGMKLYRVLYPHAKILLPNTEFVANRVIVLPTGTAIEPPSIEMFAALFRCLATTQ